MKTKLASLLGLACALALAGCATPPTPKNVAVEKARAEAMTDYARNQQRSRTELIALGVQPAGMSDAEFAQIKREQAAALLESKNAEGQRRENYVAAHPDLSADIRAAILENKIAIGMTPADVAAAWGPTRNRFSSEGIGGGFESVDYGNMTLYFANGRLVRWSKTSNY